MYIALVVWSKRSCKGPIQKCLQNGFAYKNKDLKCKNTVIELNATMLDGIFWIEIA